MSGAEDREARVAVESMARRIREAREDPEQDADVIAAEFFTILRARGWRWMENLAPPRQQHPPRGHLDPAAKAKALADMAAATEATRAQGRGEPVPARQEAGTSNQEGR